jgi:hypothetical protein
MCLGSLDGGRILAAGGWCFMNLSRFAIAAGLLLCSTGSAAAQSVTLQFQNGLVTLNARNAPVRTILSEWARIGGAKIVNAERVAGAPVTLELTNVPEKDALNVVLRNVSGYIVLARPVMVAGSSAFDRILILPTSTVTRQTPTTAFTPAPAPVQVFVPGDPDADLSDDGPVDPRGVVRIQTPQQRDAQQVQQQLQQQLREAAARAAAARTIEPDEEEQPQQKQPAATVPGMPAGAVRGSSRPGEITPVPQQRNSRPAGDEP